MCIKKLITSTSFKVIPYANASLAAEKDERKIIFFQTNQF